MSDENFITNYFSSVGKVINNLDEHKEKIIDIINKIRLCNENENKVLVAGNGGSCADAEHFAGELVCTFNDRNRKGISAIPLATHPAALTAWSNDFGFDGIFARQIETLGEENDLLICYSTSGSSKNILEAALEAKRKKMTVLSFTGNSKNNKLAEISSSSFLAPSSKTAFIQELHTIVGHEVCLAVEQLMSKK